MTTSLSSSNTNYSAVVGNSSFAINNRIYKLVNGELPKNLNMNNIQNGRAIYSFGAESPNLSINKLYQQAEDIQFSLGALDKTTEELDKVSTRLLIGKSLTEILRDNKELTNLQKENIEDQMNYLMGELDQIAYTANFQNVPLLDGTLEENGAFLNLSGNNSTDLTQAFQATTTEAFELPYPGEFTLTSLNLDEFERSLNTAIGRVDRQKALAEEFGETLFEAFDDISAAIYSSDALSGATTKASQFSLYSSHNSNGNLVMSMGYLSSNITFDNNNYDNIMRLLEKE